MHVLSWHQVDFAGVVLTGLVTGYVMAIVGLWAVPGLVAFDIADFGRRYMVSDHPSAWLLGFASHLVNSISLVLVWAMLIVPNLPWPRQLLGFAWGVFLAVALPGGLIVPLSCLGFMSRKAGGLRFATTTLLLHECRRRARLTSRNRIPFDPAYYGTHDAPALYGLTLWHAFPPDELRSYLFHLHKAADGQNELSRSLRAYSAIRSRWYDTGRWNYSTLELRVYSSAKSILIVYKKCRGISTRQASPLLSTSLRSRVAVL